MLKIAKSLGGVLALTLLAGCAAATPDSSSSVDTDREASGFTNAVKLCFQNNTSETLLFEYSTSRQEDLSAPPNTEACVKGSTRFGPEVEGSMSIASDPSNEYPITVWNPLFGRPHVLVGCVSGDLGFDSKYSSDDGQFQFTLVRESDDPIYPVLRFKMTVDDSPQPRTPRATMCWNGYYWPE